MSSKSIKLTSLILLLFLLSACGANSKVEITQSGEVYGNVYTNPDLGLVIGLPEDWIQADADTGFLDVLESQLPSGGLVPMLLINQYEDQGMARFPQFLLYTRSTESVYNYTRDENGYLELVMSALEDKYYRCIFDEITKKTISGKTFHALSCELIDSDLITTYRTVLISEQKGNYIIVAISYLDMDQFETAAGLLDSMEFVD